MATLRAAIDARGAMEGGRQFHAASEQIKSDASGIDAKVSVLQKKISQQFKFATFDERSVGRIESQFETVGEMQDRLFAATHSNLEVALKGHDDYFSSMRVKWQGNESVLTLISKTETAERKKILESYARTSTDKFMQIARSAMRMGAFTYLFNSAADTATSMLKAKRQGESMFDAFLSGIPIVNRLAKSANDLANEISGFAAATEMAAKSSQIFNDMEQVRISLDRSLQLQAAGENAAAVQARFDFEDRLKQIDIIEAQTEAIRKYNAQIDVQIELLKKSSTSFQSYGFGGGFVPLDSKELEKQIRLLKGQKGVLPNLNVFKSAAGREMEFELERQTTDEIENEYELRYNQMKESKDREIKANKEREAAEKAARDFASERARITGQMYSDMGEFGDDYYNAQEALLDLQKKDYGEFISDKVLLKFSHVTIHLA